MPVRILAALLSAALLAAGCGGPNEARTPVYPAGGTVLLEGKPLANGSVQFHPITPPDGVGPEDPATAARIAETDEAGKFTLSTYEAGDGAPVGEYAVVVLPPAGPSIEDADVPVKMPRPSPILAKYGKKESSPLRATVKAEANAPFDFDLK